MWKGVGKVVMHYLSAERYFRVDGRLVSWFQRHLIHSFLVADIAMFYSGAKLPGLSKSGECKFTVPKLRVLTIGRLSQADERYQLLLRGQDQWASANGRTQTKCPFLTKKRSSSSKPSNFSNRA